MNCHNCGGRLEKIITDLPFKVRHNSIIIVRKLPVLQCQNCSEYLLEDLVLERVDEILDNVDRAVEIEILSYAL